jgi:hypothetical protein
MRMNAVPDQTGPLSDEESQQFANLLRRYLHHELDQWEGVVTESAYGPVYAFFTNKLPDGWPHESFRPFLASRAVAGPSEGAQRRPTLTAQSQVRALIG